MSTSRARPWIRRIGCISTSRADCGIYRPLARRLADKSDLSIFYLAGGTHLSDEFGLSIDTLSAHPNAAVVPVEHFVAGDSPTDVAETAGRAVGEYARALERLRLDLVFVLGDRTEMLAAALAAVILKVPIAHLHGGDTTEGSYDDQCRHAITMLSHVHFPALREHANRIRRMGEEDWRVHPVGALALDELREFVPEDAASLGKIVGLDLLRPTVVVAFYPETLSAMSPGDQIRELCSGLDGLEMNILIIGPNADVGHRAFDVSFREFAAGRSNVRIAASLSQDRFWSCLFHCRVMLGNSSAGILEAASLRVPVVNVGRRQAGRVRPDNVLDVPTERTAIATALRRTVEPEFRAGLGDMTNPYGDGHAVGRIVDALKALPDRARLLRKRDVFDSLQADESPFQEGAPVASTPSNEGGWKDSAPESDPA